MGRAKNKKANNPPKASVAATPASQQPLQQQSAPVVVTPPETTPAPESIPSAAILPVAPLALDDDSPFLSTTDETPVIPALQPYLSLLPALRGVGQSTQRALHEALYTAGSTAAQALESYLKDKSLLQQLESGHEGPEATSESEELRLLLNYVSVEMAADNLKRACSGPDGKILLRDSDNKILNEVAAAALSAFAYAASRRPSTKHVEYLMNPTQSVDAHEDTGSQSSQTLSAFADPKLQVPTNTLPGAPYQRCSNASTGTNGSLGLANSFGGMLKPRKRSTQRRLHDADDELMTDDEEEDLEEDDVSDVDLDEDSEPLTELLDESRRTESPLDDFDNTDALLRFACTVGHVDIVKSLVEIRGSPEYVCIRKSTMLMEACCAGQVEIVRELLSAGADVNAESESRNTPLIYAATAGKLECVQELLKHPQILVDARNTSGHTALMEASSAGHLDIVKELLTHGANIYAIVENVDFKESSLSLASYRGHVDVVKCLLENMQDCPEKVDELHTGLLEAAMDGHVEVARVLLDGGALVNLPTENFESPLTLAACGGHYELVKLLLDRNADIEEPNDESYTPLMEAAREGHKEVVELLLDRGANVNSKIEEGIETPLTLAASGGYLSVVELLVQRGGNLLLGERSPLYEATQEGHVDVAEYIVKQLKKVDKANDALEDLNFALVCAAETNNMALVNLFLENGANKDCYSKDGRTPLMEAARQGHVNMLEFLLQCGADINKISPNGDATALSLACLFGHSEAVQFLLENGANPEVSLKDSVSCIIEASRNGNTDCARIVLDYISMKSKQKQLIQQQLQQQQQQQQEAQPIQNQIAQTQQQLSQVQQIQQQPHIPTSTAAEISSRPKIKPVSKLNKDTSALTTTTNATSITAPYPPVPFNSTTPLFPTLNGDANSLAQEFALLGHKLSPDLAAAAAASLKAGVMPNGVFGNAAAMSAKQDEKSKRSAAAVNASLNKLIAQQQQQQANEDTKLNELLQQLPGDLVNAMLAATATTNVAQMGGGGNPDVGLESMLAHFLQRALVEPKRREAAWTNDELNAFKEMVRQKVRQLPPPTNPLPNMDTQQQQQQQQHQHNELMMANMLSECCPGCNHNHSATNNYAANVFQGLEHANALNAAQAMANANQQQAVAAKRKGVMINKVRPRAGSLSGESSGSFGSRQVNSVKQKLAETSELLRSKLDAIQLTNESDETLQELRKLSAQSQQQQQMKQMMPNQNNSMIQTSMYLNRLNNPNNTSTTLTAEQQQQILFYQQQEINNLQNLQTAAGHHHVGSTTVPHSGTSGCHQGHHNLSAQMNCLSQLHGTARVARRTGQAIGTGATSKQLCSGKHVDRRGNPSLSAPPPNVNDQKVSSYVDMQTEANNDTALTVACVGGHAPLVGLLIQRGANVEHRDKKGFTPLILAATGGHVDCCKLLLDAGCQVDAVSERTKDTALSLACSSGRKEVVELLLRFNANKEHRNVSDYTPLSLAASGGYVEIIHLLLDANAEINSRTGSKLGISPLMLAAMNGHDQATLLLLERGSDINAQIETNRNTALTLACFQGRTEVVRLLLEYNANFEHRAKTGLTPLMEAANGGFTDVGSLLLKAGADANAPPVPTSRDTALTIAADKGHSAFVSMLLNQKAAIDVKNKKGCTPLFLACSNGHLETVKILVANNADVDALDNRKTSPLVAAFRKGFIKVVEFMVQHANQFPNDQECQRFCSTIQDPDLAMKVNKCLKLIVDAKEKQAEQADLVARSLLDQLAEEEAIAESKKLSKKRLKEKKKAKKLAKKQAEMEEMTPEPLEIEPEPKPPTPPPVQVEPPKKEQPSKKKGKKGKEKEKEPVVAPQPVVKEESPETLEPALPLDDNRVPIVHELPTAITQENGSAAFAKENHASKTNQRRQNRGRRSEQQGNGTRISIHPNTTIVSPQHSPNVAAAASNVAASIKSNDESEWCSAGKKRASSRPGGKESSAASSIVTTTNSSGAAATTASRDIYHDLVVLMRDNSQVTDAWTLLEPNGKRRAFAINVNSSTVARIIGRAGQNINAIREATNAHIEVEKIATRREQSTRQITVKGSHDAIRTAIQMIDLLIRETDTHVGEIINRIVSGSSSNASPVNVPTSRPTSAVQANLYGSFNSAATHNTIPQLAAQQLSQQFNAMPQMIPQQQQFPPHQSQSRPSTGSGTNVWQQKAAIRKLQQSSDENQPLGDSGQRPPSSNLSGNTSTSASPVPLAFVGIQQPPMAQNQIPPLAQEYVFGHTSSQMPLPHPQDDLKRKAPGFERPSHSAAASLNPTPVKPETGRPDEVPSLFSSVATLPVSNENMAYAQQQQIQQQAGNSFFSSMLSDTSNASLSALNSYADSSTPAPLSHLVVGSHRHHQQQQQQGNNLASASPFQQQPQKQRPLSEIWDNDIGSSSNQGQLDSFGGLFSSIDPKSALWLPPDASSSSKNDKEVVSHDNWLDAATSSSLFSSFGLGDFGAGATAAATSASGAFTAPKPMNVIGSSLAGAGGGGGNRPHSSTDWTNVSSAWSNAAVQPPSSAQRQPNPLISSNSQWSSPAAGVVSPPKTTATWSNAVPPTTPQSFRSSRPLLPSTIGSPARQQQSQLGASGSPIPTSTWSNPNNAAKMDVFSMLAAQVGDVAEKEKRQQTQAQQVVASSNASINNVYAAYNTAPQIQRMQQNRTSQNPTPPTVPASFVGGVTWTGQQTSLLGNPNPNLFNQKAFQALNPQAAAQQSNVHQSQQQQWTGGWNY